MPDRTTVSGLFGLKGDAWMRHANPASVWTRFAVLPLLVLAVWSRAWIGWLCLIPIVLLLVWLVVNPRFFERPATTNHWASRSAFGERLWTERDRANLPEDFRSSVPTVAEVFQGIGLVPMVYGLVVFDAMAAVCGLLIVDLAQVLVLGPDGAAVRRREADRPRRGGVGVLVPSHATDAAAGFSTASFPTISLGGR